MNTSKYFRLGLGLVTVLASMALTAGCAADAEDAEDLDDGEEEIVASTASAATTKCPEVFLDKDNVTYMTDRLRTNLKKCTSAKKAAKAILRNPLNTEPLPGWECTEDNTGLGESSKYECKKGTKWIKFQVRSS